MSFQASFEWKAYCTLHLQDPGSRQWDLYPSCVERVGPNRTVGFGSSIEGLTFRGMSSATVCLPYVSGQVFKDGAIRCCRSRAVLARRKSAATCFQSRDVLTGCTLKRCHPTSCVLCPWRRPMAPILLWFDAVEREDRVCFVGGAVLPSRLLTFSLLSPLVSSPSLAFRHNEHYLLRYTTFVAESCHLATVESKTSMAT